jgi:hypothetical protein
MVRFAEGVRKHLSFTDTSTGLASEHSAPAEVEQFDWPPPDGETLDLPAAGMPRADTSVQAEDAVGPWVAHAARVSRLNSQTLAQPLAPGPRRARLDMMPAITGVLALVAIAEAAVIFRSVWSVPSPPALRQAVQRTAAVVPLEIAAREEAAAAGATVSAQTPKPTANTPSGMLATSGRLMIASQPARAEVLVDDRYRGRTPLSLDVSPGGHQISLRVQNTVVRQTVHVDRGATVSIVAPLGPAPPRVGWIAIDSPIELDVVEAGVLLGTSRTPQLTAAAGSHAVELVNRDTGFAENRHVEIRPGEVARLTVTPPPGMLFLNAIPWAEVWIDGTSHGATPIGRLSIPIGRHEIVFRHPTLGEKAMTAIIKAREPTRLTATLKATGANAR